MKLFIQKQKGWGSLVFIFLGTILGAIFSPQGNKLTGSVVGFISSSLISYFIISPDIKSLYNNLISKPDINMPDFNKSHFNLTIDYHNFLWHPTRIPIVIGAFWFIFVGGAQRYSEQKTTNPQQAILVIIIPSLILLGVSGLITLLKGETVNKFGITQHGIWAYINGVMSILFGWGGCVFLALAYIFKW